jgi:dienelactone hydrolase
MEWAVNVTTRREGPVDRRDRSRRVVGVLSAAVVGAGAGAGFLTGADGSPGGRIARVAVVVAATVAMVWVIRRGSPALRGVTTFCVGLPSVAAGAGISIPHLSKAGWSPTAVAGIVVLVAGLILSGYGTARTVRSTPGWWRLATVPTVLAVTAVALFAGIQAVAATNVVRTDLRPETPADRGFPYQNVSLVTADGVTLSGWYVPARNQAAVLLLHGAGCTRSDVLDHAAALARHGVGVLLFDARGHGRSGGRAMDFGWYGDQDVAAAVAYLQHRPDVDAARIGAVGVSMGGEEAIGAAAGQPGIRAVVAEGATSRVAADWAFLAQEYGVRGRIQQHVDALTYAVTDLLTDARPPIALRAAAAAAAPRPMLLITAGEVPDETHAARLIRGGNADVQIWQVPGSAHAAGLATRPDEWEYRVITFLSAAWDSPRN